MTKEHNLFQTAIKCHHKGKELEKCHSNFVRACAANSNLLSSFTLRWHEDFLWRGVVGDERVLLRPVHQREGDHIVHRWVDELFLLAARFLTT